MGKYVLRTKNLSKKYGQYNALKNFNMNIIIGTMIKSSTVITALGILGWVFLPVFFAEKIFVGENPSIILMFVREIAGNPMNTEKWLFFILVSVISIVVFLLGGIKTFEKQDI